MIVDTSAIVALMLREPRTAEIVSALREAPSLRMSAATYVELCAVVDNRRSPNQRRHLDALLEICQIEIVPLPRSRRRSRATPIGTTAEAAGTKPG